MSEFVFWFSDLAKAFNWYQGGVFHYGNHKRANTGIYYPDRLSSSGVSGKNTLDIEVWSGNNQSILNPSTTINTAACGNSQWNSSTSGKIILRNFKLKLFLNSWTFS